MHWHFTSTTYGTWLPGDERGFVSTVNNYRPEDVEKKQDQTRLRHNQPDTLYDRRMPGLKRSAKQLLKCDPIYLNSEQAHAILAQFQETCTYRQWALLVASVMSNHFHAVVIAPNEVDSEDILGDLKGYASRRLNKKWGKPLSETWWAESGSQRPKNNELAIRNAVRYAWNQDGYFCRCIAEEAKHYLDECDSTNASGGRKPPE